MARPLKVIVACNIKRIRTLAGLSQQALATRCKLSVRYISKVENDPPDITLGNLERIARGLGVAVADLVADPAARYPKSKDVDSEAIRYTMRILQTVIDDVT